jgi:Carboxypeptidase regulatory-like domain
MRAFCERWACLGVVMIGLFAGGLLYGQIISSSIVGSVVDASGAAVPGVKIAVTNTGTNISVETTTGESGTYSITNLMTGTYSVTATKDGFRTFQVTGIEVQAAASVRQDVRLQVGAVHQTVQVSGAAPLIQTESPTLGGTISSRQITDLPFAVQAIDGLLSLVPGAQTAWGASNPQTGGTTHWGGNNFTMNGMSVNDSGNGGSSYSYGLGLVNLPDISSLQEFQVKSGNMNAQYRDVGTVMLVTKQGTNQFHGSAYEYNENRSLNANTFLLNAAGQPRPFFLRNQFGANLGGPIIRDKAFFFFDFAGLRQSESSTPNLNLPSMAMRQGDFSVLCSSYDSNGVCNNPNGTQLYNPLNGQAFAGNVIPSQMITSQAKTLLGYLPAPTVANSAGLPFGTPNYVGLVPVSHAVNTYTARGDYQISASDRLFAVWNRNIGFPWSQPLGTPPTYGNATNFGYRDNSINANETHIFSPTTLNDLRIGWFDHASIRSGQNLNFDPTSLFPQLTPSANRGLPTMNMSGAYANISDYGKGYYGPEYDVEISDNFTHVRGSHTFQAGIDETGYKQYSRNPNAPLGSFTFNGQWTGNKGWPGQPQSQGNALADFLLGTANSSSTGVVGTDEIEYGRDWEFYGQDTWQATRKLTVYYGVRYMYQSPWQIRDNMQTHLDITTNQLVLPQTSSTATLPANASAALFAAFPFATTAALGIPLQYINPDKNNWAPRVGFAYRPFGSGNTVVRGGYGVFYNFEPVFIGARDDNLNPPWGGTALNFSTSLPGQPTAPFLPDITFQNPFPSSNQLNSVPSHPTIYMMDRSFVNPVTQQWNLTVERQFGSNWMLRGTYFGSQAHHLQWFFGDINVPVTQTPNATIQNQRPLQPWATIDATRSGGKQNFNQLQLEAQKRFSYGLFFQAEYQWTNSLDNVDFVGGPQDWHSPNLDYGNTSYLRRHQLVVNYIYALPVGRGRTFLSNSSGVVNQVLGGWQVSGITTFGGGLPFSVNFNVPSTYVGWWGGRADRLSGSPYSGQQSGHNITSGVQWFNPAAFAPPQPWNWGNSARDTLFGPGLQNWDLSLMKTFTLPVEQLKLQVRGDFFDAFNHFNLSNPSSSIADTRDGGPAAPTAGKIFGGSGNRVIQVGMRIEF